MSKYDLLTKPFKGFVSEINPIFKGNVVQAKDVIIRTHPVN